MKYSPSVKKIFWITLHFLSEKGLNTIIMIFIRLWFVTRQPKLTTILVNTSILHTQALVMKFACFGLEKKIIEKYTQICPKIQFFSGGERLSTHFYVRLWSLLVYRLFFKVIRV